MLLLMLLVLLPTLAQAEPSTLDTILARKEIRVGTTGDYPPFTARKGESYQGFDIDLVQAAARELGVSVVFVPTTWSDLVSDLEAGRFDLAVGGITRTLERQTRVGFTRRTLVIGKCPLVRAEDASHFTSLEEIDQHGVRVAVNPGGTNEAYARETLHNATILTVADNLAIPEMIASGQVDLLITDNVEAVRAAKLDPRLTAVSADRPWTRETLGLMTRRGDQPFLNWLNLFLDEMELRGSLRDLKRQHHLP